jgi:hypothetical protein
MEVIGDVDKIFEGMIDKAELVDGPQSLIVGSEAGNADSNFEDDPACLKALKFSTAEETNVKGLSG